MQAWPETGSWWELITVLERARLVWTSYTRSHSHAHYTHKHARAHTHTHSGRCKWINCRRRRLLTTPVHYGHAKHPGPFLHGLWWVCIKDERRLSRGGNSFRHVWPTSFFLCLFIHEQYEYNSYNSIANNAQRFKMLRAKVCLTTQSIVPAPADFPQYNCYTTVPCNSCFLKSRGLILWCSLDLPCIGRKRALDHSLEVAE